MGGSEPIPRSLRDRPGTLSPDHSPATEFRASFLGLGSSVHVLWAKTEEERMHRIRLGLCHLYGRVRSGHGVRGSGESEASLATC